VLFLGEPPHIEQQLRADTRSRARGKEIEKALPLLVRAAFRSKTFAADARVANFYGQVRPLDKSFTQLRRGVVRVRNMAIEAWSVDGPQVPIREQATDRTWANEGRDIVIQPLTAHPHDGSGSRAPYPAPAKY